MKRIRTICVSLVILLVSMTLAFGSSMAVPVGPDVGTESVGNLPPEGGAYNSGDDGIIPPGGEGDPDDGYGAKPDPDDGPIVGWTSAAGGLSWTQLLDLLAVMQVAMP